MLEAVENFEETFEQLEDHDITYFNMKDDHNPKSTIERLLAHLLNFYLYFMKYDS